MNEWVYVQKEEEKEPTGERGQDERGGESERECVIVQELGGGV